jgi:hypothetical protein
MGCTGCHARIFKEELRIRLEMGLQKCSEVMVKGNAQPLSTKMSKN